MTERHIQSIHSGLDTADGADVKLTRIINQPGLKHLDPFLLLDAFGTDEPKDYIGGFPPHPHRGFQTVTYLLAGRMRHEDNQGNHGELKAGGIQWMSAGRGIIHSEMPMQENGLLMGFQLWVNLPAKEKMGPPGYQDFEPEAIPLETRADGSSIRVIAGETSQGTTGVIEDEHTQPTYLDVELTAKQDWHQTLPPGHTAFVYVHQGTIKIQSDEKGDETVQAGQLAVLSAGELLTIHAQQQARFLVVAGQPLGEPIVQRGPFVMNTEAEARQAFEDYQNGRF